MANKRRMFNSAITESDPFTELPFGAQALYLHLNMWGADDDGIVGAPLRITRAIGADKEDLEALIKAHFLLRFPSGVVAIKHWLVNNTIRRDRYTPSTYTEERKALKVKANRGYSLKEGTPLEDYFGNQLATK